MFIDSALFVSEFTKVQAAAHQNSRDKGFWDAPRNMGESIALVHSEISEMWEGFEEDNPPSKKIPEFSQAEEEGADVVIRLFDMAGGANWRLAEAIVAQLVWRDEDIFVDDTAPPFVCVCVGLELTARDSPSHNPGNDDELCNALHAEMSRVLEATRHGDPKSDKFPEFSQSEVHAAATIIRLFAWSFADDRNLANAILAKMVYNSKRPHMHGKRF